MHDIDFLPADYVCPRATQASQNLLRVVLVTATTLMVASWIAQMSVRDRLTARRDALHRQARELQHKLSSPESLQREWAEVENQRRLLDVLRFHASPSRWLSAIGTALPSQVALREISSVMEDVAETTSPESQGHLPPKRFADNRAGPLERDLDRLAQPAERRSLVISLCGAAADDHAVSRFLSALQRTDLFDRVQLLSTNQAHQHDRAQRAFAIRLQVRPVPDRLAQQCSAPVRPSRPVITSASSP